MPLRERVYSVLVVSASEGFNTAWTAILPESVFSPIRFVGSVSSARRAAAERDYDFFIINAPLPDDVGARFAVEISEEKPSVALLLVKAEQYEGIRARVADKGVYVLAKPTSKSVAEQAVDWLITTRERLRRYVKKTMSTEEKMREIRVVNRAKWLLIENEGLTESDSHRYIEKQAMDRCVTKKQVAEEIVAQYAEKTNNAVG